MIKKRYNNHKGKIHNYLVSYSCYSNGGIGRIDRIILSSVEPITPSRITEWEERIISKRNPGYITRIINIIKLDS